MGVGKFAVAMMLVVVARCFCYSAVPVFAFTRRGRRGTFQVRPANQPSVPQPQLQEHEVLDLKAIRAAEDQVLNSYRGWIRKGRGADSIGRAMDLVWSAVCRRGAAGEVK